MVAIADTEGDPVVVYQVPSQHRRRSDREVDALIDGPCDHDSSVRLSLGIRRCDRGVPMLVNEVNNLI